MAKRLRPGNEAAQALLAANFDTPNRIVLEMTPHKLISYDGIQGVSPIIHNSEVIGKKLKEDKYSARSLGNKPPGYLTGTANEEQQKKISKAWAAAVHGDDVKGTPFLTGDLKYNPLSFTPEQAQYIESTIQTNKEIFGIFRI